MTDAIAAPDFAQWMVNAAVVIVIIAALMAKSLRQLSVWVSALALIEATAYAIITSASFPQAGQIVLVHLVACLAIAAFVYGLRRYFSASWRLANRLCANVLNRLVNRLDGE